MTNFRFLNIVLWVMATRNYAQRIQAKTSNNVPSWKHARHARVIAKLLNVTVWLHLKQHLVAIRSV